MNTETIAKYKEIDNLERQRQLTAEPGAVAYDYRMQRWVRWTGREWEVAGD